MQLYALMSAFVGTTVVHMYVFYMQTTSGDCAFDKVDQLVLARGGSYVHPFYEVDLRTTNSLALKRTRAFWSTFMHLLTLI